MSGGRNDAGKLFHILGPINDTGFPRIVESPWKYLSFLFLNSRPWKYLKTGQVL